MVNGEEDTEGVVSNVQYDSETGLLTFDVAHFTRFEAVASDNEDLVPVGGNELLENDIVDDTLTNDEKRQVFFAAMGVVLAVTVPVMVLIRMVMIKKREAKPNDKPQTIDSSKENNI